jgi:hypothetical protein
MTPCGLIGGYQRFGGIYCPHLQRGGKRRQYVPSKHWCSPTRLDGIIIQKPTICLFTGAKIKNLIGYREIMLIISETGEKLNNLP